MTDLNEECVEYRLYQSKDPPDLGRILVELSRNAAERGLGGVVIYIGIVKNPVEGHKVEELYYEVYEEYTLRRFREIIDYLKKKYSIECIKIFHVKGETKPGDIATIIIAQSVGRRKAFETVAEAIELVKRATGIWKMEKRDDGVFWVLGDGERIKREERQI
ncbi:MAG: molybdenum cofactor biosynthesis protein MoaE [Desulfurococcales archaeon]|nr:molybdenum cofactor biosynthesis protein MoaE [Desulfurococcales archaeon]